MGKIFDYDGVPVLHTTSGDLKGYFYDGVYIYKGIPYAYADRFQMPVPSKWDGVKDATNYGFVCPLQNQDTPNGELMVPHRYWPQDEHCQSLNIWTNKLDPEAKKPVLVWFHGGGYAAGSSIEQVAYDGVSIAKKGDSILVSVNHRLNILGYLDLSPFGEKYKNSANAGHADMVAALQWVHDNIALFGGDPENVTIFGQSGGGMKVIDLMQIPSADGLFQKGLVMSGVMEGDPLGAGEKDGTEIVTAMMKELGFDDVAQLENKDSYFQELRANLDMDRNKIISMLTDAEDSASTKKEKQEAAAQKMRLLDYMEKEKTIETLIKNKGLPESFVVISDSGVNVTVNTEDLDQQTVTKICEIVMRQTGVKASEIVVQDVSK